MSLFAIVAGLGVALLHVHILVLEMLLWTHPLRLKTFRNTPEKADDTRVLAANQGLYNGFLAAGLVWCAVQARILTGVACVDHVGIGVVAALKVLSAACSLLVGAGLTAMRLQP